MESIASHEANRRDRENQECRLHSLPFCNLCHYDGTYSLDIENPEHQEIISKYLAKSRKKNNQELVYERTNEIMDSRRRVFQRIRERLGEEPVAAEEIVVLSSDDDSDLITPTPSLLNATQKQITSEPAKVSTVSTKYNQAVAGGNISNILPKKILTRTHLGITMPAGTPGTMTASVNYTASTVDSEVTCVSSGAGRGQFGGPVVLNSLSAAAEDSSSPSKTVVAQCPSVLTTTHHSPSKTTAPRTTDVNSFSSPGARTTNYSVEWLSLPNSSATRSSPSGANSINSSHQCEPDLTDKPHGSEVLRSTAVSLPRLGKSSSTVPNGSMNKLQTRIFNNTLTNNETPQLKTVGSSQPGTLHSSGASIQRALPILGTASNRQTSQSITNAHSSILSGSMAEGQTWVPENWSLPPPTCYHNSGRIAPPSLCAEKCSEAGRCCIIRCSSKNCPTYIPSATRDGSCSQQQSMVKFSAAAHNSQPRQKRKTLPRQISLDKGLKVQMQSKISRPFPRRDSTSSLLLPSSNFQAPYRFMMNNSPFSSQLNCTLRSLWSRSLTLQPSNKENDHSYSGQQPIPIETQVSNNAEPEHAMRSALNQDKNSSQRADSCSPVEVVESYLTRMLSSSTTPKRNVVFPSGTHLYAHRHKGASTGADPLQTATNKIVDSRAIVQMNSTPSKELTLNQDKYPLTKDELHLFNGCKSVLEKAAQKQPTRRSSGKRNCEAGEPPRKRLRKVALSTSTTETVVKTSSRRNLSGSILTKANELNTNHYNSAVSAGATANSLQSLVALTTSNDPALEETAYSQMSAITDLPARWVSECQSIASVNSSFRQSMSNQDSSSQLEQRLPPFESINGKFKSGIKEYWDKATPPPADEDQYPKDPNICVQKIRDWLLKDTSQTLLPALLSTSEDESASSAPICQAPSDYIRIHDVQNREAMYIKCDGRGFIVDASVMERASPYFKQCTSKYIVNGVEYRMVHATGVKYWAMGEILKFVGRISYNHNIMKSSYVKSFLDTLEIQYQQSQTFIYPV